ncbi:hypothetical protein D9619_000520 [Psilocybe cf. subviscida]|uniref:Uncharacterized protein n=1 Tax=Psilocybe cf. subviscida TaxID=2480587 RepID=A0A8H5BF07_9AGAR|nr:hypothetical protein D9619_000520 [Psilocybe cf. subviscida]
MKSVAFLRNTWKKWEHKAHDGRDSTETSPATLPRDTHLKSRAPNNGRGLTVTVKHVPLEISTAETVDGSWQPSHDYQPPSPIYDQFTQQRSGRTVSFSHPDSSRITLDVSYPAQNSRPSRSAGNSPIPPTSASSSSSNLSSSTNSPRTWTFSHASLSTPPESPKRASPQRLAPPSPHTPSLPSYQLLPPIELNYGPGARIESTLDLKICQCSRSGSHSRHQSHCPRYTAAEAPKATDSRSTVDITTSSQKTVHTVLDLSKPRSLYHLTKSSPHLPMKDRNLRSTAPSEHSVCSTEGSEGDFPLFLFPTPPPLIIRKRIPAPLVLRPAGPNQSQYSSPETTPVGTPTTPRFPSINSPPQSANTTPRKPMTLRPYASFSPPPSSPPNSPLPRVPPYFPREGGARRCSEAHPAPPRSAPAVASQHALRVAQSSANLRDTLPFAATHRLTSSEPSSDQVSSLPIKRPLRSPVKPRPKGVRASDELRVYSTSVSMPSSRRAVRSVCVIADADSYS